MKHATAFPLLLLGLLLAAAAALPARAQDALEKPDVVLEVDGLSCPFCAFGIEKKLKKIDGVAHLAVHLEAGKVELKMKEGATVSEERLLQAVKEAGFTARRITFFNERVRAGAPSSTRDAAHR